MTNAGFANFAKVVSEEEALAAIDRLAEGQDEVTAMIAYEHHLAARLLQAAWAKDVAVPDRLSLASFNDVEFLQYTTPAMTTVALPAKDIAYLAAEELIRQINDPEEAAKTLLLPETLIIRGSTGAPAVGGAHGG
jgi:LacI family transcriptional regulator